MVPRYTPTPYGPPMFPVTAQLTMIDAFFVSNAQSPAPAEAFEPLTLLSLIVQLARQGAASEHQKTPPP